MLLCPSRGALIGDSARLLWRGCVLWRAARTESSTAGIPRDRGAKPKTNTGALLLGLCSQYVSPLTLGHCAFWKGHGRREEECGWRVAQSTVDTPRRSSSAERCPKNLLENLPQTSRRAVRGRPNLGQPAGSGARGIDEAIPVHNCRDTLGPHSSLQRGHAPKSPSKAWASRHWRESRRRRPSRDYDGPMRASPRPARHGGLHHRSAAQPSC